MERDPSADPPSLESDPLLQLRTLIREHGGLYAPDWDDPAFAEDFVDSLESALGTGRLTEAVRNQLALELKEFLFKENPLVERLSRLYVRLSDEK